MQNPKIHTHTHTHTHTHKIESCKMANWIKFPAAILRKLKK